jgi:DNA (cytosine-5)-methyltransferase 1
MTTTQMDIFSSSSLERLKIDKPIRLIELFAGYGSQSLALKYLNADYESYRICEWNYKSFEAYKMLHCPDDHTDYSNGMSVDELRDWVADKGVSADWNKPMPHTTISHMKEKTLREIYNAAMATHNLVDISRVSSSNLGIERERERSHCYIMTYSFPCQDLSLAGKRMGMDADSGTRSSLLWQVERILGELKRDERRPDILLMENVIQVHGVGNTENFNKWLNDLHDLGYTSYFQDLEATGFGIPQTRNRCFVVSLLGEKSYEFPQPAKLTKTLKDMLEDTVDRKYYLTQKQVDVISKWNAFQKPLEKLDKDRISGTLTTRDGAECSSLKLVSFNAAVRGREDGAQHLEIGGEEKSNTITTVEKDHLVATNNPLCISSTQAHSFAKANGTFIPIRDCTKKGYDEAKDGDGVYISNIKGKRGTVQHGKIQTLKTSPDVGVVLYNGQYMFIRKFTPRECFRLMGVRDDDFGRLCGNFSDSILYHLAGDSIVVDVLMAIFRNMF